MLAGWRLEAGVSLELGIDFDILLVEKGELFRLYLLIVREDFKIGL